MPLERGRVGRVPLEHLPLMASEAGRQTVYARFEIENPSTATDNPPSTSATAVIASGSASLEGAGTRQGFRPCTTIMAVIENYAYNRRITRTLRNDSSIWKGKKSTWSRYRVYIFACFYFCNAAFCRPFIMLGKAQEKTRRPSGLGTASPTMALPS